MAAASTTTAPSAAAGRTAAPAPAAAATGAGGDDGPKSFARRDRLMAIADKWQKRWAESKMYQVDAGEPSSSVPAAAAAAAAAASSAAPGISADSATGPLGAGARDKFFVTFPYPYMNGRLHLGHAFSVTKAEFAARYNRLEGRRTLFPFAFHCTGMPIQSAANKLRRELEPEDEEEAAVVAAAAEASAAQATEAPAVKKFTARKTKTVAKTGAGLTQAQILEKVGVPESEIPEFVDPVHWLRYFPPYGRVDLERFGVAVDWRRSFITTDANLHYDSFIRWQFNRLKDLGKIKFGKRPTVYSPRDGQACADHDRASGEGVAPQEYTLIKLRVLPGPDGALPGKLAGLDKHPETGAARPVYMVAATLRPETMYGQTNVFVLPDGEYGAFDVSETGREVFVCSERSANNMSYQGLAPEWGKPSQLAALSGTDLLGLAVSAPNAGYERVYCLPLLTISMGKGTGVVTSVPSDAPDDYAALGDLKRKPALREKFGIEAHMVEDFDVVEIIEIPGLGKRAAADLCDSMGVKSQNDKVKIAEIKERTYLEGFYKGVMLVGSCAGKRVEEAKPIIRKEMIDAGTACPYFEPEKLVMSRSGDECTVAFLDQWYLEYGEKAWREMVERWVDSGIFKTYNPMAHDQYRHVLGWLSEWACSRNFGLGTKMPWDTQFVIESLSDSTVYMAYYTIAHLLQGEDNLDGSKPGPLGIAPGAMDQAAWDYVVLGKDYPADGSCAVPEEALAAMRREFEYWYPLDLRVSGKDLIGNHLTMALYNHAAIFEGRFDRMPQSFFTNGHVGVDGAKMSKSLGNFLTLEESNQRFSPDGVRFSLANAGDGMEEANFDTRNADVAVGRLFVEDATYREWAATLAGDHEAAAVANKEIGASTAITTFRSGERTFMDNFFEARVADCLANAREAYANMRFRDALKFGFFELQGARDQYRDACEKLGEEMHGELAAWFMHAQAIAIAPICPHWAEEVWETIGCPGGAKSIHEARWPDGVAADAAVLSRGTWLLGLAHSIRASVDAEVKKAAKKGDADASFNACTIYTRKAYQDWQVAVLDTLRGLRAADGTYPKTAMKDLQAAVKAVPGFNKKTLKDAMAFAAQTMRDPAASLASEPEFVDEDAIRANLDFIVKSSNLAEVTIVDAADAPDEHAGKVQKVVPGAPVIAVRNV